MTDIREALRQLPTSKRQLNILSGYVSTERPAPQVTSDPVWVIVPSHGADNPYGPLLWPQSNGDALPQPGNPMVIVIDESGTPHVVHWDTVVTPTAPSNIQAPSISGGAVQSQILTASPGRWIGSAVFTYQWERGGVSIAGATLNTYALTANDVGFSMSVAVTATNSGGQSATVTSAGTAPVQALTSQAPVNVGLPVITGTPTQGTVLSVSNGTWINTPTGFTYQWQRGGVGIGGATSSTYTLGSADVGFTVNCAVTASNAAGSASVTSAPTGIVVGLNAPVNTALPIVTGTPVQGDVLSVTNGSWTGSPTYGYQWNRVASGGTATVVQAPAGTGNGNGTLSFTFASNVTSGNSLILAAVCKSNTGGMSVNTVTDTRSNSWVKLATVSGFSATLDLEVWWVASAASGSTDVTVTFTGTLQATAQGIQAMEVHGLTSFDTAGTPTSGVGTVATSESPTPAASNEFAFAVAGLNYVPTVSPSTPFTAVAGVQTFSENINPVAYGQLAGATPVAASWTMGTSGYWASIEALFKVGSGGTTAISGATSANYTVQGADVGDVLNCTVTATNGGGSTAATSAVTAIITASSGAPLISTFTDSFPGSSLSAANWTTLFGSPTVASNTLTLPTTTGVDGTVVASANPYNLTGSSIYALITPPVVGNGSKVTSMALDPVQTVDSGNHILVDFDGTNMQAWIKVSGTPTSIASHAVAGGTPTWARVRESAGTIYWDYSSDGITWTNFASHADPFTITSLYVILQSNYTGTEGASSATVQSLNTQPVTQPIPGPYQTLVWSDEFTGSSLNLANWNVLITGGGGTGGPNIPASYLSSIGVTVGSFIGDFHDVTSHYWDRGQGGTPIFGSVNGIGTSLSANGFLDSSGVTHIRTTATDSIWTSTIPNGMSGNGRSGGAAVGFILPSRCIVEWQIAFPANPGDPTHGYGWNGPYTQTRQTTSAGVASAGYAEVDALEQAGWNQANLRYASMTYHWGPNNSTGPNVFNPTPLFPYADGNYHYVHLIKLGDAPSGHAYVLWDQSQQTSFTLQGNSGLDHCLHFTGGYTSASQPVSPATFPYDMLVRAVNVWNC